MSRVLLVSAGMGGGHDAVAAELARRLERAGHSTRTADVLALLPRPLGAGLRGFYRAAVRHLPFVYGGIYAAFFRPGGGRGTSSAPLADLARERLTALVEGTRADLVVPVFHLAAQVTGRMRQDGTLRVPSAVVVTDFAVHRQWLHPGNDLHLCLTADAAQEVRRRSGGRAVVSGPMVSARFGSPRRPTAWRRALAPDGGDIVLVSAGAWGAGSRLASTARLLSGAGYRPVVACGRDEGLRRRLARCEGVRALGWVDDMPGLLAASAAVVDNAAGQTALEALATGVPVVGYRPIPGHGAEGVRRMAALGLSDYAPGPWELVQCADRLTAPGAARRQRVAAGRAVFGPDAVAPLTALAARRTPRTPVLPQE